jgi:hypothetical protein
MTLIRFDNLKVSEANSIREALVFALTSFNDNLLMFNERISEISPIVTDSSETDSSIVLNESLLNFFR